MTRVDVTNAFEIYEVDGVEPQMGAERRRMVVESHRLHNDRVTVLIDGHRYTVVAADLQAAIKNATNTGGWL